MTTRWKYRPEGSNWGEFGPDDQRGRMNYVTREKVLQGIAEVKEGLTFCCSLPLDYPGGKVLNPRRSPPRLAATLRDSGKNAGRQNFCWPFAEDNPDQTDVVLELRKKPDAKLLHGTCSGLDGRDSKLLQWISDSGLACLLADNYAVELIPTSLYEPKPYAAMPLHEHCLFKNGIHLGEMWYFTELARWLREHKRSRFLLTAPPLRLPGAVG